MKALLTFLAFVVILHNNLFSQVIQSSIIEDVSAPLGIVGTHQPDYVLNGINYLDADLNKNHDLQLLAVPPNDNCLNAISVTVNAACITGTTKQASKQAGENFGCQGAPTQSVWYKFVATAASMYVEIDLTATSGCYEGSAVWSGTCLPSANLSCVSATANTLLNIHSLAGLTVGNTYYVQVTYTGGGPCGPTGNANTGTTFCVDVGIPIVCATCVNTCGPICVFATAPTVPQVTSSCTQYTLKPRINKGQSRTECYTFKASATSFSLQMIINSVGCGALGNVTVFNWTLQAAACGAVLQSGTLANLTASGLTVGQNYVLCYTWTAACEHDAVYPYIVSTAALPIELLEFQGTFETDHVELNWATASEINNNYFTIERSMDGIHFEKIGMEKGAGNSTEVINYSFLDHAPLAGASYYRLQQTDYDGQESYSRTIAINNAGKDFVHIMPNPARDQLSVSINSASDNYVSISVCNLVGKQIYFRNTNVSPGMNQVNVDVNNFSKGVYFLRIDFKDKSVSNLIMKE